MNLRDATSAEEAEDLLRKLVLIPSSNTDDKRGITRFVIRQLEESGFNCRTLGQESAPAIVASLGRNGVLLSGHLDTVPVGDSWTKNQGEMKGSILFGRGAADMKGGCAAILMTAAAVSKAGGSLSIAFTTDEETAMKGAELIAQEKEVSSAPAIIICEPTSLSIGAREKGLLQLRLTTCGKCSHAAMPEEGENAIHKMLLALDSLMPLARNRSRTKDMMTLNIDMIRGGTKVNVIPDKCEAEIDIRTPSNMKPDEALKIVKDRLADSDCGLALINQLDPISTSPDAWIVKQMRRIVKNARLSDIAYATEMIKYKNYNANLTAFGPGDPRQAHVINEHVDVKEIAKAASIYEKLALSFQ